MTRQMGGGAGRFLRKAFEDGITGLAAMVAYNLLLSIFPLALLGLFVAGRVLESEEVAASVVADLRQLFPAAAEDGLTNTLRRLREGSTTTGILALVAALWLGSSFWGSLDTAFCRIYRLPCRSWLRQKLFSLGMLAVVLVFMVATVAVPLVQSLLLQGAEDLPFGLDRVRGLVGAGTLVAGLVLLFAALCAIYWKVPKGPIPWRAIWPGAAAATTAVAVVDYGFPLYLSNVSSLRLGTSLVFVLIVLVWFYVLAFILLAGAVLNDLRLEGAAAREAQPARGRPRPLTPA